MVDFIVILYGINTVLVGFCLHELHKLRRLKEGAEIADVTVPEVPADVTEQYTEDEIARLEREAEFDLRISRIKEELANSMPNVTRKGSEAPILMEGIVNLPHSIIRDNYDDLPDVEITQ